VRTVHDTLTVQSPRTATGIHQDLRHCRVGLLGCGTVGSAVVRGLAATEAADVVAVAFRDPHLTRPRELGAARRTTDAMEVVEDEDVDIVVEVMGGTEVALEAIRSALRRGRPVVTANKAVVATHGPELASLARQRGTALRYDAAVAGAVPATGVVSDLARVDRVVRIAGILNGTANHVLTVAPQFGFDIAAAVEDAMRHGYAEADPSRDLDGTDTADKLVILARLAWAHTHAWARSVTTATVDRRGVESLTPEQLAATHDAGRVWRLVAEATDDGHMHVAPVELPAHHEFATVRGPRNVLEIEAAMAGRLTLIGEGAGGEATASAVLRDLDALTRADGVKTLARR